MTVSIFTDGTIAAAMQRAEAVACSSLDGRCYGFGYPAAEALADLRADGWCKIGWVTRSGREAWGAWYNVDTGEGRFKRQAPL